MNRKYLFIGIGLLVLILLGVAVYFLFFNKKEGVVVEEPGNRFDTSNEYTDPGVVEELPLGQVADEGRAGEEVAPRLIKITDGPVAFGSMAFQVFTPSEPASTTGAYDTEIRYLERASGNAYAYRAHERTLSRISNRTLPGIHEATWLPDGSLAYARFLSTGDAEVIETYALPVSGGGVGGYFLEQGLEDVVVQGTSTLATLLPSTNGSIATVAQVDGETFRTLFSSPLNSLRLFFAGKDFITYTKASAHANGYVFLVGGASGLFEQVAGPLKGLTALPSPLGTYVFYTYVAGSSLRSGLITLEGRVVDAIPVGTLSEKCTWTSDETSIYCAVPRSITGTLPDDWYQGSVSFSDRIWRIDLEGRVAVLAVDPKTVGGVEIDAVNLTVDSENDVLIFTNKKDGSLWAYDL